MGSRKVRKVCSICNSRWMSELQGEVMPILSPLILGTPKVIAPDESRTLAAWITMTTIVYETTGPSTMSYDPGQRQEFMNSRRALPGKIISVAPFIDGNGTSKRIFHTAADVITDASVDQYFRRGYRNIHCTTLIMGRFLGHVVGSQNPFLTEVLMSEMSKKLVVIHPTPSEPIRLDGRDGLSEQEIEHMHNRFRLPPGGAFPLDGI